jgi:peptidoglycan/xylan/chitin deacetylase (PgdA/CDA1 family)
VGAVLTYHRIAEPAHERDRLCVPAEEFRGHMRHLRDAGYRVRPIAELVAAAAAGSLEGRSIALTFDDGYLDALTSAAPILESFGFPATFFIVGEAIDAPHEFWWDALDRIFLSDHQVPARLAVTLPAGSIEMPTASGLERAAARDRLTESFYSLGADAREAGLRTLYEWSGTRPATDGPRRPMTADEVARLASRPGLSIGAHSHRHLRLPLLSPADRADDIRVCRTRLEAVAGRRVTSFSYPYGFVDAATVATVRAEGFDLAVTTEARALLPPVDVLQVPRIDAANTDVPAFARLLESLAV